MPDEPCYQTHGAIAPESPAIYLHRRADDKLVADVLAAKFCYVLGPPQLGKTSLRANVAISLKRRDVMVATLNMQGATDATTEDEWYNGLVDLLVTSAREMNPGFTLPFDWGPWWDQQRGPCFQRFANFLEQGFLVTAENNWVIFVDEIDTLISLPFANSFLKAIQLCFDQRLEHRAFRRFSVVLLGGATEDELFKDRSHRLVQIGEKTELTDFTFAEALPLGAGLPVADARKGPIIERVLDWTGGQPHLTLTVCDALRDAWATRPVPIDIGTALADVDSFVDTLFFQPAEPSGFSHTHFSYIAKRIRESAQSADLFMAYLRLLRSEGLNYADTPTELKIIGLVKTTEGICRVRNRIYERVFSADWARNHSTNFLCPDRATKGSANRPIRLLHLSDLHFTEETSVDALLRWLVGDIRRGEGLRFTHLDLLVISGDFTDKGHAQGLTKAHDFVSKLLREFGLADDRCIFVPGNHDVTNTTADYDWRRDSAGLSADEFVREGRIFLTRNPGHYPLRFKPFSDYLFAPFFGGKAYAIDVVEQGFSIPFWEGGIGLQFLTLNSSWEIDWFNPKRASIHPEALAHVLHEAQRQEEIARKEGALTGQLLRIAVWHHAVAGPEMMQDVEFLAHLQNYDVKLALHGDVHELRRELIGFGCGPNKHLHIIGAGSFGSPAEGRPESTPRLYNLIEIQRDLTSVRVHTRQQPKPNGAWRGWNEWPHLSGGHVPYYDIDLVKPL